MLPISVLLHVLLTAATPRLTEILPDPAKVSDDKGEWIEVCNPTADSSCLGGWKVVVGRDTLVFPKATGLAPDACVLVARSDSTDNGGTTGAVWITGGWSLPNGSGSVALLNAINQEVDRFSWSSTRSGVAWERCHEAISAATVPFGKGDWGTPGQVNSCDSAPRPQEGKVLGVTRLDSMRIQVAWQNTGTENWVSRKLWVRLNGVLRDSVWCQTPAGQRDSSIWTLPVDRPLRSLLELHLEPDVRPRDNVWRQWLVRLGGEIRLTEIQANESDSEPEWIEIGQQSTDPMPLEQWTLGDVSAAGIFPAGTVLAASGRLVVSPQCALVRQRYQLPDLACVELSTWPRLSQESDRLFLRDAQGAVWDSLVWSRQFWGQWPDGASMERRVFSDASQLASNWIPGGGPQGSTPGWTGPIPQGWTDSASGERSLELSSRVIDPRASGDAGALRMLVRAARGEKVVIEVLDLQRKVRARVHSGVVPRDGVLVWKGQDDRGRWLEPGPYVILAEFGKPIRWRKRIWVVVGPSR